MILLLFFLTLFLADEIENYDFGDDYDLVDDNYEVNDGYEGSSPPKPSDILKCAEVEVFGSELHPSINGVYIRNSEMLDLLPTFSYRDNKGEIGARHLWWWDYES